VNYKVLHHSPPGELLEVIGTKGYYYRVLVPSGFRCYIHSKYLQVDENRMGIVIGDNVNLRSIPSMKGDFPIFKVNRGRQLPVWDREGEWFQISAPEEAYAYVLIEEVESVPDTPLFRKRIDEERQKARAAWEGRIAEIQAGRETARQEEILRTRLAGLEKDAPSKFKGRDLDEVKRAYQEIAAATTDDGTRVLALARTREVALLQSERKLQQEVLEREREAREAKKRLEEEKKKTRKAEEEARLPTGELPVEGMRISVLGRVDASGEEIILTGGLRPDQPQYTIACPDGRYVLADFHGKRVAIRGIVGKITRGKVPSVVVERLEISP